MNRAFFTHQVAKADEMSSFAGVRGLRLGFLPEESLTRGVECPEFILEVIPGSTCRGVGKRVREWKEDNKECIIKQVVAAGRSDSVLLADPGRERRMRFGISPSEGGRKLGC